MLLIEIALAFLIAWSICERWVFPAYKKPDPPKYPGCFDPYHGGPCCSVIIEAHEKQQQEVILQAVKDYAEKEGIKVTYSKGEPQERPAGFFEGLSIHKDPKPMPLRLQYNGKKGENHEETETTD